MAEVRSKVTPLIEQGDIYFLYRPRVGTDEVRGLEDVQRVYMILRPQGARKFRLLIIGRKRLPDPGRHDRFWAFVYKVFSSRASLSEELGQTRYRTRTRGVREEAPVRPVAEGVYALVRHGDHTHLAYVLELPQRPGPAERELNIRRQASYIIAVKNPEAATPPDAGLDPEHEAHFPKTQRERFQGRRFIPVETASFLDYPGAELVLIGAAEDPQKELGLEFHPDHETEHTADVLKDLRLPREIVHKPLFEGRWA
ncbi:MAG: hypothetical protein JWO83_4847 [Caulobacteraceae bacterium]|nr:hypothetical protein [Caulobacteraceae bacterium]